MRATRFTSPLCITSAASTFNVTKTRPVGCLLVAVCAKRTSAINNVKGTAFLLAISAKHRHFELSPALKG